MKLPYAKFFLAKINLVSLLAGGHTASVKTGVSQDFHYWHVGPDTSFLREDYHVNSRKLTSIPSGHHPFSSCDNQKCLQTWPHVPLGLKSGLLTEYYWFRPLQWQRIYMFVHLTMWPQSGQSLMFRKWSFR